MEMLLINLVSRQPFISVVTYYLLIRIMKSKDLQEAVIIRACQSNDAQAQRALFDMFYSDTMRTAMRYSRSRQDAEEIVSNAFIKALKGIQTFDISYPFAPWMRTITIRAASDFYRYGIHTTTYELQDDELPQVHEEVLENMSYQELLDRVQCLPDTYRLVFNMYVIDGLKHHEIAERLGISVGTSKSNLFKAKNKLKSVLNEFI